MPKIPKNIEGEYARRVDTPADQELGELADARVSTRKEFALKRQGTIPLAQLDREQSSWGKNIARPLYEKVSARLRVSRLETMCPIERKERTPDEVAEVLRTLVNIEDQFWWKGPLNRYEGRFKTPSARAAVLEVAKMLNESNGEGSEELKKWLDDNISKFAPKREHRLGHKSTQSLHLKWAGFSLVVFIRTPVDAEKD